MTPSTDRMLMIAKDLDDEGLYTRANSVEAITRQRDLLVDACTILMHSRAIDALYPEQMRCIREVITEARKGAVQ